MPQLRSRNKCFKIIIEDKVTKSLKPCMLWEHNTGDKTEENSKLQILLPC